MVHGYMLLGAWGVIARVGDESKLREDCRKGAGFLIKDGQCVRLCSMTGWSWVCSLICSHDCLGLCRIKSH